jgi:hypothetical protein
MSTDAPEVKENRQEAEETPKADEHKPPEPIDPREEARKEIYAKSDSMRFPKPPPEEKEEVAEAEQQAEPEGEKPPEEETSPEAAEAEPEPEQEAEKPEKEELTPREKRKLENMEAKEKRLSAWEKKLVDQLKVASKPPEGRTAADPATVPLRYLTDEQFDEKYNELFSESPAKARRFEKSVEDARATAARENDEQRVESDLRDFVSAYPDVTEQDWLRMNDPSFYEKYPDILQAMERRNHFGAFVAARGRLVEEKLDAKLKEASTRESAKEADLRKREELKKKGSVLRVQTKVVQPPKKEEAPPSPEEMKRRRVAEMIAAARARQGLGP